MVLPCDKADMEMFRASTDISLEDAAQNAYFGTISGCMEELNLKLQFLAFFAIATIKIGPFKKSCKIGTG
jgi:hypothetical protein